MDSVAATRSAYVSIFEVVPIVTGVCDAPECRIERS